MKNVEALFNSKKSAIRALVLDHGVKVEFLVNIILATSMGMALENSKSFGPSSTSMSFSQKINLLLDLKIMKSKFKSKIQSFTEIRNKFAHIHDVKSFEDLPMQIKEYLIKTYGKKGSNEPVSDLYSLLFNDVILCCSDLATSLETLTNRKIYELGSHHYRKLLEAELQIAAKMDTEFMVRLKSVIAAVNEKYDINPPDGDFIGKMPLI